MKQWVLLPLLSLALWQSVSATEAPPEKTIGVTGTTEALVTADLAPHNFQGAIGDYELRARVVSLAPSGALASHSHAGRPGIVRVIKGSVIEYRGDVARTYKVGDYWYESADTVHWIRNPSTTEGAELWAVDLVPKKK